MSAPTLKERARVTLICDRSTDGNTELTFGGKSLVYSWETAGAPGPTETKEFIEAYGVACMKAALERARPRHDEREDIGGLCYEGCPACEIDREIEALK